MFIKTKTQAKRAAAIANCFEESTGVTFEAKDFFGRYHTNVLNEMLFWDNRHKVEIEREIVAALKV